MRTLVLIILLAMVLSTWAQTPRKLDGLEYRGTGVAEHQEGCEGCGNVGMVRFLPDGRLDYLLPGSDMVDRRMYTRNGDRIMLDGGKVTMEVRGDSLLINAYDHRYPYVRVRLLE
ncbi:MAG: hypothetical protein H6591_08830 [Flavobacteriales bacterium]|nr:hypothetical protein [Flavobacteriales bacterium]